MVAVATTQPASLYTAKNNAVLAQIQKLKLKLKATFVERDEIIDTLFDAILAKKNVLLIGAPGTAKSALLRAFASCFKSARYFYVQVMQSTKPEEIFGPLNLMALKEGRYENITTGKLPECHIADLDEVFNCNSGVLNGLNSSLNERIFAGRPIPLLLAVGSTNLIPEEKELAAFMDRWMYRFIVKDLKEAKSFEKMLVAPDFTITEAEQIDIEDIKELQNKIGSIKTDGVPRRLVELRDHLRSEKINLSPRRYKWCIDALRAHAITMMSEAVAEDDFQVLKSVLWEEQKQLEVIEAVLGKIINPYIDKLRSIGEQAKSIQQSLSGVHDKDPETMLKINEGFAKLKKLGKEVNEILKQDDLSPKIKTAADQIIKEVENIRQAIWDQNFKD